MSRPNAWVARVFTAVVSLFALSVANAVNNVSSEVCQNCHKEIYQQWKDSMHANSTAINDPIHGTFYKMVVGDPTQRFRDIRHAPAPDQNRTHAE